MKIFLRSYCFGWFIISFCINSVNADIIQFDCTTGIGQRDGSIKSIPLILKYDPNSKDPSEITVDTNIVRNDLKPLVVDNKESNDPKYPKRITKLIGHYTDHSKPWTMQEYKNNEGKIMWQADLAIDMVYTCTTNATREMRKELGLPLN